jgi:copper(I)-binding protein
VPAGATVTLAPGGLHLMFMGLTAPFVEGESVPVTLKFEKAGEVTLDLSISGVGADSPPDMHDMKM